MKLPLFIIGSLLSLGMLAGCIPQTPSEVREQTITLFFYSESDLQNAFFDQPVVVIRTIPASDDAMDSSLRLLFAGPAEEEKESGAMTSDDLTRLGPLYLGVRKDGDAAVVNFKREALTILNSAAARQFMAKEPIRRTLLQFPDIKDVKYAVDGEIFEEWDAGEFGNNMMRHGMMRGNSQVENGAGFLPGEGRDIATLPEARQSQIVDVKDGDTIMLKPVLVRKTINSKEIAMYGYNGEIPGPQLRVKQGSTFTVDVVNGIDLPTSIHWHGIRLENANDGAVGMTQEEIKPGDSFRYTVHVPDEGMYWYHPHLREDIEQDMGLYGNLLVTPTDNRAYAPVHREEAVFLDDLALSEDGFPLPYSLEAADHALMGRFGNTMFVNGSTALTTGGSPSYALTVQTGEVVRFYFTNAANTRTFRIQLPGAKMKLVGSDSGRYEQETFVDAVTLSPSERTIVDVLFEKPGRFTLEHRSPDNAFALGSVIVSTVSTESASPSHAKAFAVLRKNSDVIASIDPFRSSFEKAPDHTLVLDMSMHGGMMGGNGMMMGGVPEGGIEWEDTTSMNGMSIGNMMQWRMVDQETRAANAANKDLMYTAKAGDKLKIRIMNKTDSPHPMQHPIHFHGQRFLVLSDNGVKNTDLVWKDTVLVPAGHTVDILLDASNPGDWMFHCHIAEHLSNGMMGLLKILP